MSASIAHEINNPLAVISGSLSLLQRMRDDPDKFKKQVEIIEKSVGRISKIVNGLKKFSRSGGRTVLTDFSLRKIVNESIGLIESQAKVRNVKVTTAMVLGDEFNVLCNELEIEQVLVNLVNNAIDAIEGLSEKWVRIELGRQGTEVILQVTDSGSGIPAGVRSHLFDPFFTTKPIGKGRVWAYRLPRESWMSIGPRFECARICPIPALKFVFPNSRAPKALFAHILGIAGGKPLVACLECF